MIDFAMKKGAHRIGVLLPITGCGRSNNESVLKYAAAHSELVIAGTQWYNWGDTSLIEKYTVLRKSGAQAIILIAKVTDYNGLIKYYKRPFTSSRHEALGPENVVMARFTKYGVIVPMHGSIATSEVK